MKTMRTLTRLSMLLLATAFFFVQRGNTNKLLFGLDGGGACWDAATCVGSPLTGSSTYTVSLNGLPGTIAGAEGIFNTRNRKNPFRNYTKIFIPCCSADIHWGSKDTTYVLNPGQENELPWTIRHRGSDNFTTALYNPSNPGSERWGVARSFPPWVRGFNRNLFAQGAAFPNGFVPSIFAALAN
jgi:hypothetical protein